MKIERRYTTAGESPYASIEFRTTKSEIRNPDGSVVFSLDNIEVPAQLEPGRRRRAGAEIFPQGRRAGAPQARRGERAFPLSCGAPSRIRRRSPNCPRTSATPARPRPSRSSTGSPAPGPIGAGKAAISTRRPTPRPSATNCVTCSRRRWPRPNSPQWFNTGLHWAYGIDGPGQGHFYVDFANGKMVKSKSPTSIPQPHACFIQSIEDDLVNDGGIMDLWVREARLFKYGSGTGSNFSKLRGEKEKLSGGGSSSGLMSFLKIGDRAAGAIKSGGTTRRAAKMVVVDVDHPDIEAFIDWKVKEEEKVAALVDRLQDRQEASEGDPARLRQLRGLGRRLLQSRKEPGAQARDQARAPQRGSGQLHQARHPVRPAGLQGNFLRHL